MSKGQCKTDPLTSVYPLENSSYKNGEHLSDAISMLNLSQQARFCIYVKSVCKTKLLVQSLVTTNSV